MIKLKPIGLITHNRIYVCIDASSCLVIVDLVIIDSIASPCIVISYHGIMGPAPSLTLTVSPLLPLHRQWLPLPVDSYPAKGRPPLRPALLPLLATAPYGLLLLRATACGLLPLRASHCRSCLRVVVAFVGDRLRASSHPLGRSLSAAGCPCSRPGRGWPPLQVA
ncbi:hypothetical protein BHM03_00003839 [Ensete ventricosum]|uniref:Uncharacterized protein n=1 Tax=Ensete ventricosum TaxID=4639 RepID=A0A445MA83_ENSVE|nr:hypothetical protein BHM03_00003839 [Ensete ventricosum]